MKRAIPRALVLSLALSCVHGRDDRNGPDGQRARATALKLGAAASDTVDSAKGDAVDWRYIELGSAGQIEIQLRWEDAGAQLALAVYDAAGKKLAAAETSKENARRIALSVPSKARYYLEIAATRGASPYSLEASFSKRCHDCSPAQQTCVGKDGFAICQRIEDGCNAWVEVFACEAAQTCRNGKCAGGCTDQCKLDERRCASNESAQQCVRSASGCLQWGAAAPCGSDASCEQGRCAKKKIARPPPSRKPPPARSPPPPPPRSAPPPTSPPPTSPPPTAPPATAPPPPPPPPSEPLPSAAPAEVTVDGKIMSTYTREGKRTLHIEIGAERGVKPGMTGVVLQSNGKPMPNGEFKVVRVTGRFAIAETSLESIGDNKKVRIKVK